MIMLMKISHNNLRRPLSWVDGVRQELDMLWGGHHDTTPLELANWPLWNAHLQLNAGPRPQIREDEEAMTYTFEAPGVQKSEISIRQEEGLLTVEAKRKLDVPEGYKILGRERPQLHQKHRVRLPKHLAWDTATATLEDGLLHIRLEKKPETPAQRIEVQ